MGGFIVFTMSGSSQISRILSLFKTRWLIVIPVNVTVAEPGKYVSRSAFNSRWSFCLLVWEKVLSSMHIALHCNQYQRSY